MADGSAGDPFYVVIAGFESTSTAGVPVYPVGGAVWPSSIEGTATVAIGDYSGDVRGHVEVFDGAVVFLLGALLLVVVAQLVVGLRK